MATTDIFYLGGERFLRGYDVSPIDHTAFESLEAVSQVPFYGEKLAERSMRVFFRTLPVIERRGNGSYLGSEHAIFYRYSVQEIADYTTEYRKKNIPALERVAAILVQIALHILLFPLYAVSYATGVSEFKEEWFWVREYMRGYKVVCRTKLVEAKETDYFAAWCKQDTLPVSLENAPFTQLRKREERLYYHIAYDAFKRRGKGSKLDEKEYYYFAFELARIVLWHTSDLIVAKELTQKCCDYALSIIEDSRVQKKNLEELLRLLPLISADKGRRQLFITLFSKGDSSSQERVIAALAASRFRIFREQEVRSLLENLIPNPEIAT